VRIYVAHEVSERGLAVGFMQIARDLGHEIVDPLELPVTGEVPLGGIDLYVAIVSPRSNSVYFELGIVAAMRKEILLLARNADSVVDQAAAFPYLVIGEDVFHVEDEVKNALERALAIRNSRAHAHTSIDKRLDALATAEIRNEVLLWFSGHGASVEKDVTSSGGIAHLPNGESVVIELKTWPPQGVVSVESVRQLRSYMSTVGATRGLLLTTGSATRAAMELASSEGVMLYTVNELLGSGSLDEVWKRGSWAGKGSGKKNKDGSDT